MPISRTCNRLRELRKQSGLTLREVAYTVSVNISAAARYESHNRPPTLEVALRYEELYRVPVAQLFPGTHDKAARRIVTRMKILYVRLRGRPCSGFRGEQKLQWLSQRLAQPLCRFAQSLGLRPLRVLALDVQPASFSFVVLQDADQLLDWGARRTTKTGKRGMAGLAKRLRFLLTLWRPSVVVIRRTRRLPLRMVSRIQNVAGAESLPVRILKPRAMKRQFGEGKSVPQRQIVTLLGRRFPTLAGKLPAQRRFCDNQPYHVSMFMALAAGLAYSSARGYGRVAP